MDVLSELNKMTTINIEFLVNRLKDDLNIKNKHIEKLYFAIYDVFNIIIGITHQSKINNQMSTIAYRMIKDYWYINGFDKIIQKKEFNSKSDNEQEKLLIKSITIGDTTTTFEDNSSKMEIDGVKYDTETINISDDIITKKYEKELYKFRKMRW